MKMIVMFHPQLRRYVEELMADPDPRGQAFMARAMLNNARIRYMESLPSALHGFAGMPYGSFSVPFQWDLAAPQKETTKSSDKPRVRLMSGGNEQPQRIWVCVGAEEEELTGWGVTPLGAYLDWKRLNPRLDYWQVLKERIASNQGISLPSNQELLIGLLQGDREPC